MEAYRTTRRQHIALLAMATTIVVAFAFGAQAAVSVAADYQDGRGNVCEGPPCPPWAPSGNFNTALGDLTLKPTTAGDSMKPAMPDI